jgi:hypothetical protein
MLIRCVTRASKYPVCVNSLCLPKTSGNIDGEARPTKNKLKANRRDDQAAVSKLESTDNRVRRCELFGADSRSAQVATYFQVGLGRSP